MVFRNPTMFPIRRIRQLSTQIIQLHRDTHKGRNASLPAALHQLLVALKVGSNEDDLRIPRGICLLDKLNNIGATTSLLAVPQAQPLRLDVFVDQARDRGTESLLLITSNPDEIPIRALYARRQRSAEAGTRADSDTAFVERRCVGDTCELHFASPDVGWDVVN